MKRESPATRQKLFRKHYEVIDTQLIPLSRNPDILELIRVSLLSCRTSHLRLLFSRTWGKVSFSETHPSETYQMALVT
jgi:hypothetical protein